MCVSALKAPSWIDTVDSWTFDPWPTALYLMPEKAGLTHVFSVPSPLESSEQLQKRQNAALWVTNQFKWAGEFANMDPWTTRSNYMKKKINMYPTFLDQLCFRAIGWWEKGFLQQSSREKIQGKCQNVTFVALLKWCIWTVIIKWLLKP